MSFLIADRLVKNYGTLVALDSFSLEVAPGTIFALVGPDGAGKTTMMRILCRLLDPDSGMITIAGRDAAKEYEAIKPILGYMPQQFSLYPDLSIEENLTFYAGLYGITGQAFREKREQLYEFSNLKPFSGRRAGALSGGMKQKLALSCALIHDPRLLILDEPTTGVDPLSRRQFWEILLQLKAEGVTTLVSTPYMDEVARCDRAAFIYKGRKLAEDTPAGLAGSFTGRIYYIDHEPTTAIVQAINRLPDLSAARFGAGLHLYLDQDDNIERHLAALASLGVAAERVTPIKAELEDRFIQLMETGA
ncbi:MAG: ABC transporter ATP-binding protein [Candidatus Zixiibacteriota bacterium]